MSSRSDKMRSIRERNDRIEALHAKGVSYRRIAARVGMSLHGVYRVCHDKLCLPRRGENECSSEYSAGKTPFATP